MVRYLLSKQLCRISWKSASTATRSYSQKSIAKNIVPTMSGFFGHVPLEPPNAILGIALDCKNDTFKDKINLTIGAYRTETGEPYVLPCVREAEEEILAEKLDHEYLSQDGLPEFTSTSKALMFGDDAKVIAESRVHSIQSIAGTGSLRLGTTFLNNVMPGVTCYIPDVTWPNHPTVLNASNVPVAKYKYMDSAGTGLDFPGMIAALKAVPEKSIVLLHCCAHNPTGVDPTEEQWREILEVVKSKNLFPFFDNAYQGFVSGDPNIDAYAVRLFADAGLEMIVACSFSKNFGLYGERLGVLHLVTKSKEQTECVSALVRALARGLYSTCPSYGARIVGKILGDPDRKQQWEGECNLMAKRLTEVRHLLYERLTSENVKGTWGHIIAQRGMFSFTGISKEAVVRLRSDYHIYMLMDGRISLAGLNNGNTDRFVSALKNILGTN